MSQNIFRILWVLTAVVLSLVIAPVGAAVDHPLQLAMNNYSMAKMASGSGTSVSGKKYIKILSPANGSRINARTPVVISYDVTLAPGGNHIHFYVDNHFKGLTHELKGSFSLGTMAPGIHTICIKEATVAHVLIGVNRCITVTVK
jgi:hypothetical protein